MVEQRPRPARFASEGEPNARPCPVCRIPLHPVMLKQTQIDFCLTCRGIWFDKDELSQVRNQGGLPDKFLATASLPNTRDAMRCPFCNTRNSRTNRQCRRCGTALSFLCPACGQQLEEVPVGTVRVDRCRTCQGVWFDGGELAVLFEEFKHRKKTEIARIRREGGAMGDDLAAWAAIDALDVLIWHPELVYHAGHALGHAVAHAPGAVAHGIGAAGEFAGDLPELAGGAVAAAGRFIGNVPELAGDAAAAAGDLIGNVPEMAGNVAQFAGDMIGNAPELAGNLAEAVGTVIGNVPEVAGALAEAGSSFIEMLFELIGSLFDS